MTKESKYYEELINIIGEENDDAARLVFNINGFSIDTMNDILFCMTGYRSVEQYWECEGY